MSVSTKLGDEFLRIPKLDVSGTNWVIFKDRFTWALDARGILDHIDGTSKSVLQTTTAGTQTFISSTRKMKPSTPIESTKPGCRTNTKLGSNPSVRIEGESI